MSPEQARGQAVDKRTDIWAFGCVLFEMLAGRRAFDGDTMSDTFVSILEREPDWDALPAETPPSIRTLLERCLRKDPRKRLHDIADALIEIDDGAMPAASARPAAVQRPVAPGKSRESLAWVVASVLGMASIGMASSSVPCGRPHWNSWSSQSLRQTTRAWRGPRLNLRSLRTVGTWRSPRTGRVFRWCGFGRSPP